MPTIDTPSTTVVRARRASKDAAPARSFADAGRMRLPDDGGARMVGTPPDAFAPGAFAHPTHPCKNLTPMFGPRKATA